LTSPRLPHRRGSLSFLMGMIEHERKPKNEKNILIPIHAHHHGFGV
jgi:hypothetical protein